MTIREKVFYGKGQLDGIQTTSPDLMKQTAVTHEGLHGTNADMPWQDLPTDKFNSEYQAQFNKAAAALLGENE